MKVSYDTYISYQCLMCHFLPGSKGCSALMDSLGSSVRTQNSNHDEVNLRVTCTCVVGARVFETPGVKDNQIVMLNEPG